MTIDTNDDNTSQMIRCSHSKDAVCITLMEITYITPQIFFATFPMGLFALLATPSTKCFSWYFCCSVVTVNERYSDSDNIGILSQI